MFLARLFSKKPIWQGFFFKKSLMVRLVEHRLGRDKL